MMWNVSLLWVLAADTPPPTSAPGGSSGTPGVPMLVLFGILFVVMWLFVFGPQRKKEKHRRQMLEALTKGAKVVTIGGIHGTILDVTADAVVLDIGENTKMLFSRGAIARIESEEKSQ